MQTVSWAIAVTVFFAACLLASSEGLLDGQALRETLHEARALAGRATLADISR
jgi:hypothetical protein